MEQDTLNTLLTLINWLKTHYCWHNISFWDFSLALFFISTFCRIVFHNYETTNLDIDVEGHQAYFSHEYR